MEDDVISSPAVFWAGGEDPISSQPSPVMSAIFDRLQNDQLRRQIYLKQFLSIHCATEYRASASAPKNTPASFFSVDH